jgi:hypothetical protein
MLSAKGPAGTDFIRRKSLKQVLEMPVNLLRPHQTLLKRNRLPLSNHPTP